MNAPAERPVGPLSGLLRRGAAASGVALVAVQAISFLQTLVLARLLRPDQVGIFAAGTVLTLFLATFAEGALTQALIQRADGDLADAAETVFRVTLFTGLLLAVATVAASPLVGIVVGDPVAGQIAAATAGALVLHAVTNVPDALMQRRFDFRRRLVIDPAMTLAFALTAIPAAALGLGVWSLVVATYVQMAVWATASWWLGGWRPGRGTASVRMWRELARYGFPLLLGTAAERVRETAEILLVGRLLDIASLGFYRYGKRLAQLPGMAVLQVGAFVIFPAFARIAGDRARVAAAFVRALQWLWVAALPVTGLLVAVGEPIATVLLGQPWRGAGVALVAMSGVGVGQVLSAVSAEALKGVGRSARLNAMTAVSLVSGIGLLVLLLPLGLSGVGAAMSAAALAVGVTGLVQAVRTLDVRPRQLVGVLARPVAAVVPATAGVYLLDRLVLHADRLPTALGVGALLLEAAVLAASYVVLLRLVAPAIGRSIFATVAARLPGFSARAERDRRRRDDSRSGRDVLEHNHGGPDA